MHGVTNPGAPLEPHAWKLGSRSAEAMTAGRYLRILKGGDRHASFISKQQA